MRIDPGGKAGSEMSPASPARDGFGEGAAQRLLIAEIPYAAIIAELDCNDDEASPMPTVLNVSGFRFFFYSLEGTEPPHIHVERDRSTAKFWLTPVELAESRGFRSHELNRIRAMVIEHRAMFQEAWHGHFGIET